MEGEMKGGEPVS